MQPIEVKQILVIRNDTTQAWEDSEYILLKGETGIGWLEADGKKKPIVKVGDGKTLWTNLPQAEYVFQKDLNLTYSFGRHVVDFGCVNAGGKGMTISEWIMDALAAEKEPTVIQPNVEVIIDSINTDSGDFEIGSIVESFDWSVIASAGLYEFGSENNRESQETGVETTAVVFIDDFKIAEGDNTSLNGTRESGFQISGNYEQTIGVLKVNYSWGEADGAPVTNMGKPVPTKKIVAGKRTPLTNITVNGYREGLFYGCTKSTDAETIRNLFRTGKNYYPGTEISFTIPRGTEGFILATPKEENGVVSVYNNSVNAEMLVGDNFKITEVNIPGANNFSPIPYTVLSYEPAFAYENETNITIKLG